jgi:hypothetical protein
MLREQARLVAQQGKSNMDKLMIEMILGLEAPRIIPMKGNGRANRMRFFTALNAYRGEPEVKMLIKDHLTIIGREDRVLLGPKNFDVWLYTTDVATCTQEELTEAFDKSYPKGDLIDFYKEMTLHREARAKSEEKHRLPSGEETVKAFFESTKKKPEENEAKLPFNPYDMDHSQD